MATRDGAILWDMDTYTPLATLQHSFDDQVTDWITSVALSPDGNTLAVGRWNGVVELWRATL